MSLYSLRFLGVGNGQIHSLGASSAVLECQARPSLMIDCGPDSLAAYERLYGHLPRALFITHAHFDHIGGLEGLFYRLATASGGPSCQPRLYCPVSVLPVLQRRLADFPNILAEGGSNFWDVFQLIPVSAQFWHDGLLFTVFPVRHHAHLGAFGLALAGRFLFTGDTRPIPEVLTRFAGRGELIFHDCAAAGNPSHTGVEEIAVAYRPEQWQRMVLYHYESEEAGRYITGHGYRIARCGECFDLSQPARLPSEPIELETMRQAVG